MEATVQALLPTNDQGIPVKFRRCDISKEIQSLTLGKTAVLMAFEMNVSGIFQEDLLCI
jgi:hypothetical protein